MYKIEVSVHSFDSNAAVTITKSNPHRSHITTQICGRAEREGPKVLCGCYLCSDSCPREAAGDHSFKAFPQGRKESNGSV